VDVGAQAAIWDHIKRARRAGLAVLLISADLEELVGLSDNIRVMLRGRLSGDFDPDTVTREELGAAMTGADAPEPTSEDDLTPADPHTDTAEVEPRRDRTESGSGEVEPRRDRTESGSGEGEPR
jgi:simple sugar transport system ATP-binding protein